VTYTVVLLDRARGDVQPIYDWIAERSPEGAERWFAGFEEAVTALQVNPFVSPIAPEDEFFAYEIRHLIFQTRRGRPYRAILTVVGDQVRILRVRGSGQPPLTPQGSEA
jgi:plasmid stabilization system protein ParE